MSSFRVRYQTLEFDQVDIHLRTLRDKQQFSDDAGEAEELGISSATWPMFGVVWDSSEVLARFMFHHDIEGLRILEVGCGIGLTSLMLGHRKADITATDQHPEAERFLERNVSLNGLAPIPFVRTGWADDDCGLGEFDLIIGSDLLYESPNVEPLAAFIDRHAKARCEVIIVDPGRGQQSRFSTQMQRLGYSHSRSEPCTSAYLAKPFRGHILRYAR
jgi:predicted nicotinamide N-methyase